MGKHIPIHQIVCVDKNGGIGKNGDLPWKIEGDWQYFLNKTLEIQVTVQYTLTLLLGPTYIKLFVIVFVSLRRFRDESAKLSDIHRCSACCWKPC